LFALRAHRRLDACAPSLLLASRCRCRVALLSARVAFADASRLTAQAAQVIKFRPSYPASFHHVDMVHDGRVQRENSLDANPEACLTHGDGFPRAAMLASNDYAFESL